MFLWNIKMQSRPGADKYSGQAAPKNGPSPTAGRLRCPAVPEILGLDVVNAYCKAEQASE